MVRRIIAGLAFAGILVLVYFGYRNWKQQRSMMTGEVTGMPGEIAGGTGETVRPESQPAEASNRHPTGSASARPGTATSQRASTGLTPPSDTLSPDPPNGTTFAGTGHFQVYRQGNLTWRIDTDSGQSCILFATNEEWRKPQVYQHGCGSSAAK